MARVVCVVAVLAGVLLSLQLTAEAVDIKHQPKETDRVVRKGPVTVTTHEPSLRVNNESPKHKAGHAKNKALTAQQRAQSKKRVAAAVKKAERDMFVPGVQGATQSTRPAGRLHAPTVPAHRMEEATDAEARAAGVHQGQGSHQRLPSNKQAPPQPINIVRNSNTASVGQHPHQSSPSHQFQGVAHLLNAVTRHSQQQQQLAQQQQTLQRKQTELRQLEQALRANGVDASRKPLPAVRMEPVEGHKKKEKKSKKSRGQGKGKGKGKGNKAKSKGSRAKGNAKGKGKGNGSKGKDSKRKGNGTGKGKSKGKGKGKVEPKDKGIQAAEEKELGKIEAIITQAEEALHEARKRGNQQAAGDAQSKGVRAHLMAKALSENAHNTNTVDQAHRLNDEAAAIVVSAQKVKDEQPGAKS